MSYLSEEAKQNYLQPFVQDNRSQTYDIPSGARMLLKFYVMDRQIYFYNIF